MATPEDTTRETDDGDSLHVILVTNPAMQASVYGTKTGRVFKSERAALRMAKQLEEFKPHLDVLVLPVYPSAIPEVIR